MSTYANVRIHGNEFHTTHDGTPDNILEELREYVEKACRMAKPGFIPEITAALIAMDAGDAFSFFHHGNADPSFGKTYDVEIGPRGGLRIRERR